MSIMRTYPHSRHPPVNRWQRPKRIIATDTDEIKTYTEGPYHAISYMWKGDSVPSEWPKLLRWCRKTGKAQVWLDQRCINDEDRATELPRTWSYYKNADSVLIVPWLAWGEIDKVRLATH